MLDKKSIVSRAISIPKIEHTDTKDREVQVSPKLREVQEATIKDMDRLLTRYGVCNVERPMGFGKTDRIINYVVNNGMNPLYLYDRNSNKNRVIDKYNLNDYNVRSYSKFFRDDYDIFTSYITENNIDIVIFDESHTVGAKTIDSKWIDCIEFCMAHDIKVVGCTGTELRMNGVNVTHEYFHDKAVFKYDIEDAVNDGLMMVPLYFTTAINEDGFNKIKQELTENERRIILEANNIEDLIDNCLDESGRSQINYYKIIVFCTTISEVVDIRIKQYTDLGKTIFKGMDVNVIPVTSNVDHADNVKKIDEYVERPNAVDIFISVDMMNQGFHFEDLSGIILHDQTSSGIVYPQRIGRCMSVMNKRDMFVLDLAGNIDIEFKYRNKVAELFNGSEDARSGHDWSEEKRNRVRMSAKQRNAAEIVSKLKTQKQVSESRNLAAMVKFYNKFPEKNVLVAGEAAGLSDFATMEYLDNLGLLRDEDKLVIGDDKFGLTRAFRLVAKYKYTHKIN